MSVSVPRYHVTLALGELVFVRILTHCGECRSNLASHASASKQSAHPHMWPQESTSLADVCKAITRRPVPAEARTTQSITTNWTRAPAWSARVVHHGMLEFNGAQRTQARA